MPKEAVMKMKKELVKHWRKLWVEEKTMGLGKFAGRVDLLRSG